MRTHRKYDNLFRFHEADHDSRAPQPAFAPFDVAKLQDLRRLLKSTAYTEESISKRLRISHITAINLPHYPIYYERLRQNFDSLAVLITLFLIQGQTSREAVDGVIPRELVDELLGTGLLAPAGEEAMLATVSIYPCSGFHFITDHQFWPVSHEYYEAPAQPVMHLGADSYALAHLAPDMPTIGRVLDLCTGSGIQAILSSRQCRSVIGVDINPRAVEFARFNAALNGVESRCDFRCGSLYDPVKQTDSSRADDFFDLILANPPFIPSPHAGPDRLLERDGGPAGDAVLAPVLSGLLEHLKPDGWALIMSYFVTQRRYGLEERIRTFIRSGVPVDLLLLQFFSIEPEELVAWFTWHRFGDDFASYTLRFKEWLNALRSTEVTLLTNGVLAVRRNHDERSSFRMVNIPLPVRPQPDLIQSEFSIL